MENFETGVIVDCEADDCIMPSSHVAYLASVVSQVIPDIKSVLKGYEEAGMNNLQIACNLSVILLEQFDKLDVTKCQRLEAFLEPEEARSLRCANEKREYERRQREREERWQSVIRNNQEWRERAYAGLNAYDTHMREISRNVTA